MHFWILEEESKASHHWIKSVGKPEKDQINDFEVAVQQRYLFVDLDDHKDEVKVVCEVMDVCTSFDNALKKYDEDNHTEKHRDSEVGRFIYSIHLLLSDSSLNGEVCNAYIYTHDRRGL